MPDNGSNEYKAPLIPVNIIILLLVFRLRYFEPQPVSSDTPRVQPTTPQESGVTVPSRPVTPLYKGEQGQQRSEIEFTPSSRTVTIKFHVEDPNGYFLPNIRKGEFACRGRNPQKNVSVEIEHSPISVALLMELGGRYHELNKVLRRRGAARRPPITGLIGPPTTRLPFQVRREFGAACRISIKG